MSVLNKIKSDFYTNPETYPSRSDFHTHADYRIAVAAWNEVHGKYIDLFRKEALEEVGLADHPKADKIMAYAWEKGHSAGLHEVLGELQELVELFV